MPTTECHWFGGCSRPAMLLREHGILGHVPICEGCNDMLESWLDQLEVTWRAGYEAGSSREPAANPYTVRKQP